MKFKNFNNSINKCTKKFENILFTISENLLSCCFIVINFKGD